MGLGRWLGYLIVTKYGTVTGGAYQGYSISHDSKYIAFISPTKKPFSFSSADVKEHTTLNSTPAGTQIKIMFKNGETSIITVNNSALGDIEGLLL